MTNDPYEYYQKILGKETTGYLAMASAAGPELLASYQEEKGQAHARAVRQYRRRVIAHYLLLASAVILCALLVVAYTVLHMPMEGSDAVAVIVVAGAYWLNQRGMRHGY